MVAQRVMAGRQQTGQAARDPRQVAAEQLPVIRHDMLVAISEVAACWQRLADAPTPHNLHALSYALAEMDRAAGRLRMVDTGGALICPDCGEHGDGPGWVRWECRIHSSRPLDDLAAGWWRMLYPGLPEPAQQLDGLPPEEQERRIRAALAGDAA